jgi:CRISPR-associated protein Csc3
MTTLATQGDLFAVDDSLADSSVDSLESFDTLLDPLDQPDEATAKKTIALANEPMFSSLLRRSVEKLWPGDPVLHDFVQYVAGPLSAQLGHVTAKGGDFVVEKAAEGVDVARYQADQSMRAHLINGLFPTLHVARILQQWDAPQLAY